MLSNRAIDELKKVVDDGFLFQENNVPVEYYKNVTALTRTISAVVKPSSAEQVKSIVDIANQFKFHLYPISCGKNWGLGSRLSVQNDAVIVDLSRMNRILEVNSSEGYVVIEPGVTQIQLYKYLIENKLPFTFNVTGSAESTSVIGNAIDRGVGYFSPKIESLLSMEVVLGNGNIIHTGYGHFKNAKTIHHYPAGIGPSLDGLFIQGNFGIVTKAGVELIHKKEQHATLVCGLENEDQLEEFINAMAELRQKEFFTGVMHIGNKNRSYVTLVPILQQLLVKEQGLSTEAALKEAESIFRTEVTNAYTGIVGIGGNENQVREIYKETKRLASKFGKIRLFTAKKIHTSKKLLNSISFLPFVKKKMLFLKAVEPLNDLTAGIPSNGSLWSLYYHLPNTPDNFTEPDLSATGHIFCLPVIPLNGKNAIEINGTTKKIFANYGFDPHVTLNVINKKAMGCVISVTFNRENSDQLKRASECITELTRTCISKGYLPYRIPNHLMDLILNEDVYWQTVRDLKIALDPNNIISPGRYNLV